MGEGPHGTYPLIQSPDQQAFLKCRYEVSRPGSRESQERENGQFQVPLFGVQQWQHSASLQAQTASISLRVFPPLVFQEISPFAEPPCTTVAAALGLLNSASRVNV